MVNTVCVCASLKMGAECTHKNMLWFHRYANVFVTHMSLNIPRTYFAWGKGWDVRSRYSNSIEFCFPPPSSSPAPPLNAMQSQCWSPSAFRIGSMQQRKLTATFAILRTTRTMETPIEYAATGHTLDGRDLGEKRKREYIVLCEKICNHARRNILLVVLH